MNVAHHVNGVGNDTHLGSPAVYALLPGPVPPMAAAVPKQASAACR